MNVLYAWIATTATWAITALGASLVFFIKKINNRLNDIILGFSAGVMLAASYFSLLAPAVEMTEKKFAWLIVGIGFALGGIVLLIVDRLERRRCDNTEKTGTKMLILSITLHNIPEGLAIGVAFGSLVVGDSAALIAAISLAVGIGIQNFPEGTAVALPLRNSGMSRTKSFLYGQASALVEPVAGVIGALLVTASSAILPYALAFSAGAMVWVVVSELIPNADSNKLCSIACLIGFLIMMSLDVAL